MRNVQLLARAEIDDLKRRWAGELPDFRNSLSRHPDEATAFRHAGLRLWADQKCQLAAHAFTAALSLKPLNASLWGELAGAYIGLPDLQLAEESIRQSLALDSTRSQPWLTLADLLGRRDDLTGAADAYGRAIAIDPNFAPSHFGLGITLFKLQDMGRAIDSFNACVRLNPGDALAFICLGNILYKQAEFGEATAAFQAAAALLPLDPDSRKTLARAMTFKMVIDGKSHDAIAAYQRLPPEEREDIEIVLREGFALLSGFGHKDGAAEIGRIRLQRHPDDPIQQYLLDAVTGQSLTVASPAYIERHFDEFAPRFDGNLVQGLKYRGPSRLCELIARQRSSFSNIVDLGCGTGLAAELLAGFRCPMTGVDLSSGMLQQAARHQLYTSLVKADVVSYLVEHPESFDLIFAADLLVYIGDLEPFIQAAAAALTPGGMMALSIETTADADFLLQPSGRFAHRPDYLERLYAPDFRQLETSDESIRLEINRPVAGQFLLLELKRSKPLSSDDGMARSPSLAMPAMGRIRHS